MIEIRSMTKTYTLGGSVINALDGVSLDISAGEMVAITGPSGSGKSTLMHMLGCLDRPDGGTYRLAGEDVSGLSDDELAEIRNRRIGFVFQTFNLLPRATALENVALPSVYGSGGESKERAEKALAIVGLSDRMGHEPNQLSGGQRQRVALARALVMDPAIILADEPTGNLDSKTGKEILALFKELNEAGRTLIVVTHDGSVASYCPRELQMLDGKIVIERNGDRTHATTSGEAT
jgi:putative ABC transport system ATP-binding protein